MKKSYSKLKELNSRIADCDTEMKAIAALPFYKLFSLEAQRQKDLAALQCLKEILLKQKLEILDVIAEEVNMERNTVALNCLPY